MVEMLEFVIYLTLASTVAFFTYLACVVWRTFYLEYRELVRSNNTGVFTSGDTSIDPSRSGSLMVLPITLWDTTKCGACGGGGGNKKSVHSMETLAAE